jgi:perosamine synthetase
MDEFVKLRVKMGEGYLSSIGYNELLIPQKSPEGYKNTYYTFAALFNGDTYGIAWHDFRKKYMEYGGDGIYAAWQTVNNEPCFREKKMGWGDVPVAEKLQRCMMQFTTNQSSEEERNQQTLALKKTLRWFS